jgi:hypothetical protein
MELTTEHYLGLAGGAIAEGVRQRVGVAAESAPSLATTFKVYCTPGGRSSTTTRVGPLCRAIPALVRV